MLADKEIKILSKLFTISSHIGFLPIKWVNGLVVVFKPWKQRFLLAASYVVNIYFLADSINRARLGLETSDFLALVIHTLNIISMTNGLTCKTLIITHLEEYTYLMNQIVGLSQSMRATYMPSFDQNLNFRNRTKLFKFIAFYCYGLANGFSTAYIGFMYLTNYYGNSEVSYIKMSVFLTASMFCWAELQTTWPIIINSTLAVLSFIKYWTDVCCTQFLEESTFSNRTIENLNDSIMVHKITFLIAKLYNGTLGQMYVPMITNLLTLATWFSAYAIIRLRCVIDFYSYGVAWLIFVGTLIFMFVLLGQMSNIYDVSSKYHNNCVNFLARTKCPKMKQVMKREIRAQSLIRCQIGSFYYMEGQAKLTTFDNLFRGIFTLLVLDQ